MAKKLAISEDVFRMYRCFFCDHLLTVPPIMVSNTAIETYKCGRCRNINTQSYNRVQFLENIAQHLSFPCSYIPCTKKLIWGHVEMHEANCQHRTLKCPIYYHNCSQILPMGKILGHFKETHSQIVKTTGTIWEMNTKYDYVLLLQENNELFFIYILHLDDVFSVAVLALNRTNYTKFNVKLLPIGDDNCAVNFENLAVKRYDERSQCYMCWRKKCRQRHHIYSTINKIGEMSLETFANKLKKSWVDSVKSPSGDLRYSLTLIKADTIDYTEELSQPEEEEEELKLGAHVSSVIPSEFNVEAIRKGLSCPYCMTYMSTPIFTCMTGHTICNVCRPRLKQCPMCAGPFGEARNYTLEEMAKDVGVPCQYDVKGCTYVGTASKIYIHEMECSFSNVLRE